MNQKTEQDTQGSRWEVFKQDTPKKPHQAVGSVHASDPEHALLTARNVFVRRPNAVSLWVVPAGEIFSRTAEELAGGLESPNPSNAETHPYLIFRKTGHRRSLTFVDHVGEVEAGSPEQALSQALDTFADEDAVAWWVVPASAVVRSDEDVVESWFEPAKTKIYKQQSAYGLVGTHPSERGRDRDG